MGVQVGIFFSLEHGLVGYCFVSSRILDIDVISLFRVTLSTLILVIALVIFFFRFVARRSLCQEIEISDPLALQVACFREERMVEDISNSGAVEGVFLQAPQHQVVEIFRHTFLHD